MKRSVLPVVCAAVLVLAACSDDSEPSPPPTIATSSPTATSTPTDDVTETATAEPTSEEPTETETVTEEPTTTEPPPTADGPPELPPEAMEDTREGARAFALHFFDVWNYAAQNGDDGSFAELTTPDCERCREAEEEFQDGADANEYADAPVVNVSDISVLPADDGYLLIVNVVSGPFNLVDSSGDFISGPHGGSDLLYQVEIERDDGGNLLVASVVRTG